MNEQSKSVWSKIKGILAKGRAEVYRLSRPLTDRLGPVWRQRIRLLVRWLLFAAVATVILAAVAIYGLGWNNRFTRAVSSVVPYPAAFSRYGNVSYYEYARTAQRMQIYAGRVKVSTSAKQLSQAAMTERLNVLAARHLAVQKGVKVTSGEINDEYNRIIQAQGGEKMALDVLKKQYGMSKSDYLQLIKEQLLYNKAQTAWESDADSLQAARNQAGQIILDAQGGADFNALASRYSQDPTANNQGDAALIEVSRLPENVATAARSIKDGEVVARPVVSGSIIYVVKRIKTSDDQVFVRGITLKPLSFGRRIGETLTAAQTLRLVAR